MLCDFVLRLAAIPDRLSPPAWPQMAAMPIHLETTRLATSREPDHKRAIIFDTQDHKVTYLSTGFKPAVTAAEAFP
jgi:hypothetical protein